MGLGLGTRCYAFTMRFVGFAGIVGLVVAAGCSSSSGGSGGGGGDGGVACPSAMPANGTACMLSVDAGPAGAVPVCGYTTSDNPCGAVDCYCQSGSGLWNCAPTCIVEASTGDGTTDNDAAPDASPADGAPAPEGGDAGADASDACVAKTANQACGAQNCGSAPDGCGGMVACGLCGYGGCTAGMCDCNAVPALNVGECQFDTNDPYAYACSTSAPAPAGCVAAQTGYYCCPM